MRDIVITGRGLISAAGSNVGEFYRALQNGQSGLKKLSLFNSARSGHFPVGEINDNLTELCGESGLSRSSELALIAAREAIAEANLSPGDLAKAALINGACTGGMLISEELISRLIAGEEIAWPAFRQHECSVTTGKLAAILAIHGPISTISTACTSGALAIAIGADLIQTGAAEVVLCGGTDSLTRLTLNGFASLLVVSDIGPKPFDAHRQGMSLAEGAAFIVLESADHARKRGAKALATLAGYGASCDAYHASGPHPEGLGAVSAMEKALKMAAATPDDIGYINAHGTGTKENDRMEAKALQKVFKKVPPFSSTKAFYGHPLAASGAIEAILSTLVLEHNFLPANLGFKDIDPEIALVPLTAGIKAAPNFVMSNSFGFGGNNVVLIFGRPGKTPTIEQVATRPAKVAIAAQAAIWPEEEKSTYVFPEWLSFAGEKVQKVPDAAFKSLLPPMKIRRLGRVQIMALAAAQKLIQIAPFTDREATVLVATGLGEHSETAAFIENMARNNEATPMPAKFINSVHNSLAGQLAIWHQLSGENHTFTHNKLSLTAALWEAMVILGNSRAKEALLLACDTLSPYALLAGRALNCLKAPLAAGEGAAAWRLTAAGSAPEASITLEAHLEYRPELLKNADLLLAAGDAALPQDLPADLPIATWEEKSGVFCTSSGLGLTAATDSLSCNALSKKLTLKQGSPGALKRIILCETLGQRRFAIVAEHL